MPHIKSYQWHEVLPPDSVQQEALTRGHTPSSTQSDAPISSRRTKRRWTVQKN